MSNVECRQIRALPVRGRSEVDPPMMDNKAQPAPGLPHELLTLIFEQLDVSDLFHCHLVCKAWRQAGRDDTVLRRLCKRRGYVARGVKHLDANLNPRSNGSDHHKHTVSPVRGPNEVNTTAWEQLLKRESILHQIKFPPTIDSTDFNSRQPIQGVLKGYSNRAKLHGSDIWRVKIDAIDKVLITTSYEAGGLHVLDLEDGALLWSDPSVQACADLEYSSGWVVHSCPNFEDGGIHFRILKFDRLSNKSKPHRGVLVPAGSIKGSITPDAFRLRFPYFAVAGSSDVAIYDVVKGKLLKHVRPNFGSSTDWRVRDVEFDRDFIFLLATPREPYDESDYSSDSGSEDEVAGGLFVFENRQDGRLIYSDSTCKLVCSSSWDIEGHGMDDLRYDDQLLHRCSSQGLSTAMQPSAEEHRWQYGQTSWCSQVETDPSTDCLVLCGLSTLLIIPNYKKAFKKAQESRKLMRRPRLRTIGVGTGCSQKGSPHLSVHKGAAIFIASAHGLPTWIDLRSLLRASRTESDIIPRATTLCLGSQLLEDCSGFMFKTTSSLQMVATKLVVVCDLFEEITRVPRAPYSIALVMDFGKVLDVKLSSADAHTSRKPSTTDVQFYPHNFADDVDELSWRERRDNNADSRVILPDGVQRLWRAWAPQRLPGFCPGAKAGSSSNRLYYMTADGRLLRADTWAGRHGDGSDSDEDEWDEWASLDDSSEDDDASEDNSSEETDESRETSSGSESSEESDNSAGSDDEGQDEAAEQQDRSSECQEHEEGATKEEAAQEDLCTKLAALSTSEGDEERGGADDQ